MRNRELLSRPLLSLTCNSFSYFSGNSFIFICFRNNWVVHLALWEIVENKKFYLVIIWQAELGEEAGCNLILYHFVAQCPEQLLAIKRIRNDKMTLTVQMYSASFYSSVQIINCQSVTVQRPRCHNVFKKSLCMLSPPWRRLGRRRYHCCWQYFFSSFTLLLYLYDYV